MAQEAVNNAIKIKREIQSPLICPPSPEWIENKKKIQITKIKITREHPSSSLICPRSPEWIENKKKIQIKKEQHSPEWIKNKKGIKRDSFNDDDDKRNYRSFPRFPSPIARVKILSIEHDDNDPDPFFDEAKPLNPEKKRNTKNT